jgi:hypothetical protein
LQLHLGNWSFGRRGMVVDFLWQSSQKWVVPNQIIIITRWLYYRLPKQNQIATWQQYRHLYSLIIMIRLWQKKLLHTWILFRELHSFLGQQNRCSLHIQAPQDWTKEYTIKMTSTLNIKYAFIAPLTNSFSSIIWFLTYYNDRSSLNNSGVINTLHL